MRAAILSILCGNAATAMFSTGGVENKRIRFKYQIERALSGSGDMVSFDDEFWAYAQDQSSTVVWSDYSLIPKSCMIL
jgi:hypothetical protein